jgi:hypothetical protein
MFNISPPNLSTPSITVSPGSGRSPSDLKSKLNNLLSSSTSAGKASLSLELAFSLTYSIKQ